MAVPNHRFIVEDLYDHGDYDLTSHDGQARFVDDAVAALNAHDQRWGFLKKTGSGAQIHGHSEDGSLYLSDTPGQSQHVDFIAGAGGPNPSIGWQPDIPRYSRADWYPPSEHPPTNDHEPKPDEPPHVCPKLVVPTYAALGDAAFFRAMVGVPLAADYAMVGQPLNDGVSVWFARTLHSLIAASVVANGQPIDAAGIVRKHRNEWRVILGLPAL